MQCAGYSSPIDAGPTPSSVAERLARPLPGIAWCAGLAVIGLLAVAILETWGLSQLDRAQQFPLVLHTFRGDLDLIGLGSGQTSGPGVLVVALPAFALARLAVEETRAYDIAMVACLIPLAVAAIAASRASGVVRRSGRELLTVASMVLGVPILACYLEAFHPADVLATATVLGAFAALSRTRVVLAGALLGLALVTRQWALIPLLVLLVLADRDQRLRLAIAAIVAAGLLLVPFAVVDAHGVAEAMAAPAVVRSSFSAAGLPSLPDRSLYLLSRILPMALVLGLCAILHERGARFAPQTAAAALTVALLLRPLVDPGGFLYYVAPGYAFFVLLRPSSLRFPILGALGSVALWLHVVASDRFPAVEGKVMDQGGRVQLVGGTLAVLTTAMIAAAIVAAWSELRRRT